jgi:ATP-binding cassette subfamily F protein 3
MEGDIAGLETRIKSRDQELADPQLYQDFSRWNELHMEQEQWRKELDRMTARWESLSGELEGVRQKLTVLN